jgi:hypothetical protein
MNLAEFREKVSPNLAEESSIVSIPDGWIPRVSEAYDQLLAISETFDIERIENSGGFIKFFIYDATPEMVEVLESLYDDLITVCEKCGGQGSIRRFSEDPNDNSSDHVYCENCIKPVDPYEDQ